VSGATLNMMLRRAAAFSLIELITVVAIMAVLVTAAVPTAASLFNRRREDMLRESLVVLRTAIAEFRFNGIDDDRDLRTDEDARGDGNHDGLPGIRFVDDDGDLLSDEDWGSRLPFSAEGGPNGAYDWRVRADDDEDGVIDEEAFPGDLNEMASKMPVLRRSVPIDPTSGQAAWATVALKFNNDSDYFPGSPGSKFRPGLDPVIQAIATPGSQSATYDTTSSRIAFPGKPPASLGSGEQLQPLVDEDPRNGIDDDGDGLIDEDAIDMVDVRSLNDAESSDMSPYSSW
jgi:prepilin-type N-terminal cleavage/methylation domain-containing protein